MSVGSSKVNAGLAARRAGVKVARDASKAPKGAPQRVNHVVRGEIVFVNYNDEKGIEQTAMYFKVGDKLMATADTTEWCATKLFPISEWMQKEVEQRLASEEESAPAAPLPDDDDVAVLEQS